MQAGAHNVVLSISGNVLKCYQKCYELINDFSTKEPHPKIKELRHYISPPLHI